MRVKSMLGLGFEPKLPNGERDFKSTERPIERGNNAPLYGKALHGDAPKRTAPATTLATTPEYRLSGRPDLLADLDGRVLAARLGLFARPLGGAA